MEHIINRSSSFPVLASGFRSHQAPARANTVITKQHSQSVSSLVERCLHVLTGLESFYLKEQDVKYVQMSANVDRSAQELSKELKKRLGVQTGMFQKQMVPQRQPAGNLQKRNSVLVGNDEDEKDELELFLFKTDCKDKMNAFTKFMPCQFPLRFLKLSQLQCVQDQLQSTSPSDKKTEVLNSMVPLTKENQSSHSYYIAFVSHNMIDHYLKASGYLRRDLKIVQQTVPKAITGDNFERRGKLKKKSEKKDTFKERIFLLEGSHIYFYKDEKTKQQSFSMIKLENANIRIFSMEWQKPTQDLNKFPPYFNSKNPYLLEIEDDTRKYTISSKSHFDLEEWYRAILAQVEQIKNNNEIERNNTTIKSIEERIAVRDRTQVTNLAKMDVITGNRYQPLLLDFINDVFITELLPNLTQYRNFADTKELQNRAQPKGAQIIQQLSDFLNQAKKVSEQTSLTKQKSNSSSNTQDAYKRYKTLPLHEKIVQLVTEDDLAKIKKAFEQMPKPTDQQVGLQINKDLFEIVLSRIIRVIRYNFLNDFGKDQISQMNSVLAQKRQPLGFNSLKKGDGKELPDKKKVGKQANIFLTMAKNTGDAKFSATTPGMSGFYLIKQEATVENNADNQSSKVELSAIKKVRQNTNLPEVSKQAEFKTDQEQGVDGTLDEVRSGGSTGGSK